MSELDDLAKRVLADASLPQPLRQALEAGVELDEIRLDRFGRWWHQNVQIENERVITLFNRSVDLTENGTFLLVVGPFSHPIVVEDTPYFVKAVAVDEADARVLLVLNDGSQEPLDVDTLTLQGDRLIAVVKAGRFEARFLRSAYHNLLSHVEPRGEGFALCLGDHSVQLRSLGTK